MQHDEAFTVQPGLYLRQKPVGGGKKGRWSPHPSLSPFPPLPLSIPLHPFLISGGKVRSSEGEVARLPPVQIPPYVQRVSQQRYLSSLTVHKTFPRNPRGRHIHSASLHRVHESPHNSPRTCWTESSTDTDTDSNCPASLATRCHRNRRRTSRSEYPECCVCNPA